MSIKAIATEDFRLNLRDIIDNVFASNDEVVIERYRKPTAVVISYAKWQALKRLQQDALLAEAKQIDAAIDSGKASTISHDDLKRLLLDQRKQGTVAHVGD